MYLVMDDKQTPMHVPIREGEYENNMLWTAGMLIAIPSPVIASCIVCQ